jgi:hypothetical protein
VRSTHKEEEISEERDGRRLVDEEKGDRGGYVSLFRSLVGVSIIGLGL